MNIEEKVKEIIAEAIKIDVNEITEETGIGDFASWDSLQHLLIISTIEKQFDFKLDPEVIMDLEDVGDIVEAVEERIEK